MFEWEVCGVVCVYLRLQGGNPHLCWLMTICNGTLSEHLISTDRMLALWDLVNQHSSMIVVVGWYPIIPLEMFSRIVYGPPMNSPVCGITWNACTRERWDLDRPYDVIVKGCHTWPVHGSAYVMLFRFIPLQDLLLIRISTTLSDMSDNLFTGPTRRNACFIRWWVKIDNQLLLLIILQWWLFSWMF
jgi:hypothetical protein